MTLQEVYRLIDNGKIDELMREVGTLQGKERFEGEFWRTYWLLVKTGDMDQAKGIINKLVDQKHGSAGSKVFLAFAEAIILYFEGKFDEALEELDKADQLITRVSGETSAKVEL